MEGELNLCDEKNVVAWDSTTHAENTVENAPTLLVDWVTASFRARFDFEQIFLYFGVHQLENLEVIQGARYGFAGYHITYRLGTIELMHNENEEKYLINMSGQACREYELLSGHDFVHFFSLMSHLYPVYTRLDIAVDIYNNIFNTSIFRNAVYNEQCLTRLKKWGIRQEGNIVTGNKVLTMDSFYLGGKNSRYFINVYDKKLERADKGLDVSALTWTRLEVRFKDEYAEQMVKGILLNSDDFGNEIFEFLNDKVVFLKLKVAKNSSNRSRDAKNIKNHAEWWRSFLNTTKKLHLTVYKPDLPLLHSKAWLLDKVSTTLSLFSKYYSPEDYEKLLLDLRLLGDEKMTKKHLKRLEHQVMLDNEIAAGLADIDWLKNTVTPLENKIYDLSTNKQKQKYKEKLDDIYWDQVKEQQIFENKKNPFILEENEQTFN